MPLKFLVRALRLLTTTVIMALMKTVLLFALAIAVWGQQAAPKKGGGNQIPPEHGDDVKGYNDTPQIPNQPWKVHDMNRPRAVKVTPGPYVMEGAPSDAIVLFDGKDLSHWVQTVRGGGVQEPKWKVENGYIEIVP